MSFRFQRRKKINDWLGLNFSRSGVSPNIRTKIGSFSPRGFSFRTGIPGLSYRGSFSKKGLPVLVIFGLLLVVINLFRLLWYLLEVSAGFIGHMAKK
ncbi:hypothetical protein WJR50_32945 [Catalinimonas sp. 4WD22]|uniref:hypothetical protein n=1 Tax=Catalinimonas locisalis TaxID=3133978 RepID=UPI0031018EDC